MVSRLFGKLDASRQLTVAPDCAIAGAATVLAAIPAAAFFRNARRFMVASVANRCSCYERRLITDVTSAEDSVPRNRHALDQYRAALLGTARNDIVTDRDYVA